LKNRICRAIHLARRLLFHSFLKKEWLMKSRSLSFALTGLLLAAASSQDAFGQEELLYNQVQQKHTHNSYQRLEGVLDQVLYYSVRSLELDIHIGKPGEKPVPGDWYVWHTTNDVDTTTCDLLSECLQKIASVNQVIPEHEIVTIWVEFKDGGFDSTHTPAQLNSLLSTTRTTRGRSE
jgi:hypothetical protein